MAFISAVSEGYVHQAGQFLAHEECTRETRTIPQTMGTAVGTTKYVKSGTIFPAYDGTAIGIIYEDTDVTVGDAAGSVVTKGEVIEAKLPQAEDTYDTATVPTGGNPKELGLYERSGSAGSYVYTLTTDTTAGDGKTYYAYTGKKISSTVKTALVAVGFKFVTEGEVTRPNWTNS